MSVQPTTDNLIAAFSRWVERTPEQIAVESEADRLTYRQLDDASGRLAIRLGAEGVHPGDLVVIAIQRSVEGIVTLLAALKAGAAYVMVDPTDPPAHVGFILSDTGARLVITLAPYVEALRAHEVPVVEFDSAAEEGGNNGPHIDVLRGSTVSPDTLAYVMYTSGSTGRPKGVMIEHRHVLRRVEGAASVMPRPGEAMLQVSRLDFDAQTWEIWGALTAGARLVIAPPDPEPGRIAALLDEKGVDIALLSPGLFRQLVETHLKELGLPRLLLVGGDVLSPTHALRFVETHPNTPLVNLYGPTEVTVCGSFHRVEAGHPHESVPIGRALGNTTLYLLDDAGAPVAEGEAGELFIGGSCVGRGYLHRPEETALRFLPDAFDAAPGARMYRTGDRARVGPDGALEFLGRSDDQVKIRGFRIEPAEVEACIRSAPLVAEAVVVPREDLPGHRRLVAYVVFERGATEDPRRLRDHVASRLPPHMVPSAFIELAELPRTSRGKIDRRALPQPTETMASSERRPPGTATEVVVTEIWKRVLHLDELGIDESFLEVGGDSLLAVRVVVAVHDELGVELRLRDVFDEGTVARLSARIDEGDAAEPVATLPDLEGIPRRPRAVPVTMTQAQTCLISEMADEALPYQFQALIAFHGRLDVDALNHALNRVVARHELLRTRFVGRKGTWFQVVETELTVPVPVVDVSSATEPDRVLDQIAGELAGTRIPIDELPLVRWKLVRLADDHHVLVHVEHHLVHDGWSWSIFLRELAAIYRDTVTGAEGPLAPLTHQFRDFAEWQERLRHGVAGAAQLAYWKERLAQPPSPLALPSDRPRPTRSTYRGSRFVFPVPDDLAERLRDRSKASGVTLFMAMLAAFYTLLRRYTGEEDIVVGSGVANRRLEAFESIIGMVLNTVALRADLSGDPTVDELLDQVRQMTLDAFANQDVPFEDVLRAVQPARHAGAAPLYQVLFSFQDPPTIDLELPGVTLVPDDTLGNGSAKADLNVVVVNRRAGTGSLSIVWEYSTDLFDELTAKAMLDTYIGLLEGMFNDGAVTLSQVPSITREQGNALTGFAGTTSRFEREDSIADLFESRVEEHPDAAALLWDGGTTTYEELNRGANRLAHRLAALGAGPGAYVVVAMERSPALVQVLLGILKTGAAYVALDTASPPSRILALLEDTRPAAVCVSSRLRDRIPPTEAAVVVVDEEPLDSEPEANPLRRSAALEPAYVAYTSGTSGTPKGVVVPNRAVVRLVRGTDYASFSRSETFLFMAPIAFDASTFEIWGPLLNGARLAIAPDGPMGPEELAQACDRFAVTTIFLTTALFNQVVEHKPSALGRLHQLLTGGEVVSPGAVAGALEALPAAAVLVHCYGPTENTTFTSCHRIPARSVVDGAPPIGRPIPNTSVYITDQDGALVPPGAPGELVIGGDGLALGYLGDPVLTAARFVPDVHGRDPGQRLYRTGDQARWRPDGTIEFLGRIDRQIKVRGFRVEPEAVERALLDEPSVREAFVLAQDLPDGRRLVAYVTPAMDEAAKGVLREALRQRVAPYEVPSLIVSIDALPLNVHGKVDQGALPLPSEHAESTGVSSEPVDGLERQLLDIWREVLGIRALGPDDDFFDSGGHSLLAVSLFARIEQETGVRLPLSTIFEAPTVHALGDVLQSNGWNEPWRSITCLTATGSRPPVFFVTAGDGNNVGFGALARRLGPDQPFYALQPRGMDGRRLLEVGVEKIARHYVNEVRAVQATGPYILGGRCFGTLVAFEMTRILESVGQHVSLLIALDSVGPLWKERTLANGVTFDEVMNLARCFNPDSAEARADIFDDPTEAGTFIAWLREPVEVWDGFAVNRYVHTAYRSRPDLQAAYPLAGGQHAGLLHWAWVGGRSELGMNPDLIPAPSPEARGAPQSRDPRYRSPAQRLRARSVDWIDVATRGRVRALAGRRQERMLELAARMVLEYRAGPCTAPVALLRSEEYRDDATLARWYGLETGGIEECYVEGSHESMMREPDVASLARSVEALVAGA